MSPLCANSVQKNFNFQFKKKNFINFTDFTNKRTSFIHTSNIVTKNKPKDNEETPTVGIATAMFIATVIVLNSLVAIYYCWTHLEKTFTANHSL